MYFAGCSGLLSAVIASCGAARQQFRGSDLIDPRPRRHALAISAPARPRSESPPITFAVAAGRPGGRGAVYIRRRRGPRRPGACLRCGLGRPVPAAERAIHLSVVAGRGACLGGRSDVDRTCRSHDSGTDRRCSPILGAGSRRRCGPARRRLPLRRIVACLRKGLDTRPFFRLLPPRATSSWTPVTAAVRRRRERHGRRCPSRGSRGSWPMRRYGVDPGMVVVLGGLSGDAHLAGPPTRPTSGGEAVGAGGDGHRGDGRGFVLRIRRMRPPSTAGWRGRVTRRTPLESPEPGRSTTGFNRCCSGDRSPRRSRRRPRRCAKWSGSDRRVARGCCGDGPKWPRRSATSVRRARVALVPGHTRRCVPLVAARRLHVTWKRPTCRSSVDYRGRSTPRPDVPRWPPRREGGALRCRALPRVRRRKARRRGAGGGDCGERRWFTNAACSGDVMLARGGALIRPRAGPANHRRSQRA